MAVKHLYSELRGSIVKLSAYAVAGMAIGALAAVLAFASDASDTDTGADDGGARELTELFEQIAPPAYAMRAANIETGSGYFATTHSLVECLAFVELAMARWEDRIGDLVASCHKMDGTLIFQIALKDGRPVLVFEDGSVKDFTRVRL